MFRPLLPDIDILRGALDRSMPVPALVTSVALAVEQRRLWLVGWVRQGLLTRCSDLVQAERLARALAPFPDIAILTEDHIRAAFLIHRLRQDGTIIQAAQALHWVMAERIGGLIWSQDRRWFPAQAKGCPVIHELPSTD